MASLVYPPRLWKNVMRARVIVPGIGVIADHG
jgi:hypothetical protein